MATQGAYCLVMALAFGALFLVVALRLGDLFAMPIHCGHHRRFATGVDVFYKNRGRTTVTYGDD